ncbi:MAG: DUF167 domain-containing protein [Proteobacteria bacterium]|nr:DUF167 domain-containing protein [Pseudomonadota bacterium]
MSRTDLSAKWLSSNGDSVVIQVYVQPGAKKAGIVGLHGDAIKIKISSPPVDGQANEALCQFLSFFLDVSLKHISILRGHQSRTKFVQVIGISLPLVQKKFDESR